MTKDEFLKILTASRGEWDERWKAVDLSVPHPDELPGKMSLRDILYHVAWYEDQMVVVLEQKAVVGSPWWGLPLDERNANIHAEGRSFTFQNAYFHEQETYENLFDLIRGLSDGELMDPGLYIDMPPEWKPWEMLASNTYEHYQQHLEDIK